MCLRVNEIVQDKMLKRFEKSDEIVCYKVLTKTGDYYNTPFRGTPVTLGEVLKSDARSNGKKRHKAGSRIIKGIHVYLTRKGARVGKARDDIIVKIKCKKEDFIAAGYFGGDKSAVFKKVFVTKERV